MVALYGEFFEKLLLLSALPLARYGGLEGPDTVQDVTLSALQEMDECSPERTRVGFAAMATLGTSTVIVFEDGEDAPPGPLHEIWYVEVVAGLTETLPEVAPPVENPPAAVQDVALVELHVNVADSPLSMVLGLADRVAVGRNKLQVVGLLAPLLHTRGLPGGPSGLVGFPPPPVHPPLLHATQDPLT